MIITRKHLSYYDIDLKYINNLIKTFLMSGISGNNLIDAIETALKLKCISKCNKIVEDLYYSTNLVNEPYYDDNISGRVEGDIIEITPITFLLSLEDLNSILKKELELCDFKFISNFYINLHLNKIKTRTKN